MKTEGNSTHLDTVLVTGGAGFVGSHAAEYYAEQRASVTALDNLRDAGEVTGVGNTAAYNGAYLGCERPDVDLVRADVCDEERIEEVVEGHDAVVHTAGRVAVTASLTDPGNDFEDGVERFLEWYEDR